jgi:hypothetical protein
MPAETQDTSPTVLERFPAHHPCGSWPADEYTVAQRVLTTDQFLVVTATTATTAITAK